MTFSRLFLFKVLLVLALAAAFLLSCGDETCGPGDDSDMRGTPEKLLNHLAESFNDGKIEWYESCLADGFVFELTAVDAESLGLEPSEPWLDRETDVAAVTKMLSDEHLKDIVFTFDEIERPIDWDQEDTYLLRARPDIRVETECSAGSPVYYVVNETYLDFIVARDPDDEELWVISEVREIAMNPAPVSVTGSKAGHSTATRPSTLGRIKSIYVKAPGTARTAEQALADYTASIEARDIETYGDCLAYDHRFIFTEALAECLRTPWWDKEEDLQVMSNMFSHQNVTSLRFTYGVVSRDTATVGGERVVEIRILPDVMLLYEAPGEEPIGYWVHDEYMDFEFRARGVCSERWVVSSVEEIPFNPGYGGKPAALTEPSSWGIVKAMFR
jgi:hypothetical protein